MEYFFIVGCGRSGTTWLRMLLAQHSAVASPRETHLFDRYVSRLYEAWKEEPTTGGGVGLQAVLTEDQFATLCADFTRGVMQHIAEANPGAKVVVEKTPGHVRHVPLILKLLPDTHFIHMVRDPRSVVASLCAAGRSWGRSWASTSPAQNARLWASAVSAGRAITSLTNHHTTVKYESLLEPSGWQVLKDLFGQMHLEVNDVFCQNALKECTIDQLRKKSEDRQSRGNVGAPPTEFFRKGKADSWTSELSVRDVEVIEYIAGDLMREYGYPTSTKFASHRRKPLRLKAHDLLESLEWRANRTIAIAFRKAKSLV